MQHLKSPCSPPSSPCPASLLLPPLPASASMLALSAALPAALPATLRSAPSPSPSACTSQRRWGERAKAK